MKDRTIIGIGVLALGGIVVITMSALNRDRNRCKALEGEVGKSVSCGIYDARPNVCARFPPGSWGCNWAREMAGLPFKPYVYGGY